MLPCLPNALKSADAGALSPVPSVMGTLAAAATRALPRSDRTMIASISLYEITYLYYGNIVRLV